MHTLKHSSIDQGEIELIKYELWKLIEHACFSNFVFDACRNIVNAILLMYFERV